MKRLVILAIAIILMLSSCHGWFGHRITGNGNVISENRNITGFTGIDVSASIDVYVKQDSVESVRVETDANLQEYVITRIEDGVLHIYPGEHTNLNPTGSIKVYVSGKNFKFFEASSASDIHGESKFQSNEEVHMHASSSGSIDLDIKSPKVSIEVSSAGNIKLAGETKDFSVDASSGSSAHCFDLMAENTNVQVSSGANADVFASVKLSGGVSSGGDVKYKGNASTSVEASSGGSVNKQ